MNQKPEFLAGNLDDIDGTLNLDLGAGRHTLAISDEGAPAGDAKVLITDVRAPAAARDANLALTGQNYVVGLAPAGISYQTTGSFADGIRIWSSGFADGFLVDGAHRSTGVRTTTWLNTGLGNDVLVVDLQAGQDGYLVLNTQGPNDNVLPLGTNLVDGDEPLAGDRVSLVTVNGVTLAQDRYVVSSLLDSIGLFDSFLPGDAVAVQVTTVSSTTVRCSGAASVDVSVLGSGTWSATGCWSTELRCRRRWWATCWSSTRARSATAPTPSSLSKSPAPTPRTSPCCCRAARTTTTCTGRTRPARWSSSVARVPTNCAAAAAAT
ncbi:MAG: hypothetical protein IPL43_02550 [Micropruina sp.]|nr:hypothetical protein [Micropruina sp.]